MKKLSFQDAFFLRAETPNCPFHVASLMVLSPPEGAPANYLRKLVTQFHQLPSIWPVFGYRLENPTSLRNPKWIETDDYDPKDHVLHYQLPPPGKESDLLDLVGRAHEQQMDRARPLWQVHVIEGLSKNRFAVYFKVHHALIDGVGGIKLMREMLTDDPKGRLLDRVTPPVSKGRNKAGLGGVAKHALDALLKQAKALPEAYSLLANLGLDNLLGKADVPQLPFSAPRTILNTEITSRRRFVIGELPLKKVKQISQHYGGTINDVLVAIFGSALRGYLSDLGELPRTTLEAGIPVSVKTEGGDQGNQLSFMICPFVTHERDPAKRLKKIIRTTKKAKKELAHVSPDANEDLAIMTMIPFLLVTLTHSSQAFPPVFNTIVSNVPGPQKTMYLEGAKLERLYPMSVVTDGMGLNITVISYNGKLCIGITCAPSNEPNIDSLGRWIKQGFKELADSLKEE